MQDESLYIVDIAKGSEGAFEVIYNRYKGLVFKVCLQMTGNSEDAKDLTQKVFFELNRKAQSLTDHPSLSGWLYSTAKNICRNHLRSVSRNRQKEMTFVELHDGKEVSGFERIELIEDGIEVLPCDERQLIIQFYYEGKSQNEIAEDMEINPSTLRTRLQKAKENLQRNLKLKGAVVAAFFTSLESRADEVDVTLPTAAESFTLINKSGGILMKTIMTSTLVAGLLAAFIINFAGANEPESGQSGSAAVQPAKPAEIKSLTQSHNNFGFKLLKELHAEGKNVFISPTSINTAFGMLHNGTVGEIKKEFENVFGWGDFNQGSFNSANKDLMAALLSEDKKSILEIANSIWIRQGFEVNPAFKMDNMKFFNSEVNNVPFNKATVDRINGWCDEKTHGKIKEIIKELKPLEVMALINAVYFKGTWTKAFDKKSTYPQSFTLADNTKVKVPLMFREAALEYLETDEYQAVRLPFGKGETAMTFILPKGKLSDFQKGLTDKEFQSMQTKFSKKMLKLFVPRFKIEYHVKLKDTLINMGLKKSFGFSNGFAKINPTKELAISRVIHKTFLEVKEEGAEAAAVTAILMKIKSARIDRTPVMRIDRPFLCAITNTKTGNVIFVGTIYNPLK